MNYLAVAKTDVGIVKQKNQDSLTVKKANINGEPVVFAVLCDGMGGLEQGEVASATVIRRFENWFVSDFPRLLTEGFSHQLLREQWEDLIAKLNDKIQAYGKQNRIRLGTTITTLLLYDGCYYISHVGDSRAYEIGEELKILTQDQTVVAMEIKKGLLTEEQAKTDPRRSILLQCVGASDVVLPDFYMGEIKEDAVYMLCSDGFRHEITPSEIQSCFSPSVIQTKEEMEYYAQYLIDLNKSRKERDNITVVLVRTYE